MGALPTRILWLVGGYVAIVAATVAASTLVDDALDRAVLLAVNPDAYVPVLDEAVVLVTDFSERILGVVLLSWLGGYLAYGHKPERRRLVARAIKAEAVLLGVLAASGALWGGYELEVVFVPCGAALGAALWGAARSFERCDDDALRRFARVVGLVALSSLLTSAIAEGLVKQLVARPRPLADVNAGWNHAVRLLPDEVVRVGHSYASGHAAGLFALVTPLVWAARRAPVKAALLLWALLHAATRVYVAAHYPACALAGSFMGFAVGSLVFFSLGPARGSPSSLRPPPRPPAPP